MGDPPRKVSASFPKALAADKVPPPEPCAPVTFISVSVDHIWPVTIVTCLVAVLNVYLVCVQVALEEVDDVCKCRHIEVHGMTTSNS